MHSYFDEGDHDQVYNELQRILKHAYYIDAAFADIDESPGAHIQNKSDQRRCYQDSPDDL